MSQLEVAHVPAAEPSPSNEPPPPRRMTPRRWAVLAGVLALGGVGAFFALRAPSAAPASEEVSDGFIHLTEQLAKEAGVKTARVTRQRLTPTLELTGKVTYDPRLFANVSARITGRVRAIHKLQGEPVKAGEVVLEIESADLGRAQAEVLKARAKEAAALADASREDHLAEARVTSARDAEHAKATAAAATAERQAAERALEALGGKLGEGPMGHLALRSPIAGKIVQLKLSRGQTVAPTEPAFLVADLSRVWVDLSVFERDLFSVHAGDPVELHPQVQPNLNVKGKIAHVGEILDPTNQGADVRVEVENPEGLLRPGLSVVAVVDTTLPAGEATTVPKSAVAQADGNATVFVVRGPLTFEPRKVELGAQDRHRVAITRGLEVGEEVAVEGVFAIKSEIFR